jgi:hypothetical protein
LLFRVISWIALVLSETIHEMTRNVTNKLIVISDL